MTSQSGTVSEYIDALKGSPRFLSQVIAHKIFAAQTGTNIAATDFLSPELTGALASLGLSSLYSHQVQAIKLIRQKKNVLITTPTASGKSLIYTLSMFEQCTHNPQARGLFLFPLKALAQDQLKTINQFAALLPDLFSTAGGKTAAIYDGDTSGYFRKKIRDNIPPILISNPDMLHLSLLPYHHLWATLFSNLTHVVVDEAHVYRGVFGSHMTWVIRRLRRICNLYGSEPTFILSSATIGNPETLGKNLLSAPVEVISKSTAPQNKRNVLLLNPQESAPYAATLLLEAAVHRKLRTIVYTQSRKMTELITMWCAQRLKQRNTCIASYRSGFLPEDRRGIEQKLSRGELLGVISTSALELGIDIGGLDICLLVGYPGSIMATWQRAGRVGRGGQESLVVFIGHEDALDQHFMRHPNDLFKRPVEPVSLNPENEVIAGQHLHCAAAELPLTVQKENNPVFPLQQYRTLLRSLTQSGDILQSADGTTWFSSRKFPQHHVNLRGSGNRCIIYTTGKQTILGEIDSHRACKECHNGAIYLHMARTWEVTSLDLNTREIIVSAAHPAYYTRAMVEKDTKIIATKHSVHCGATTISFGRLRVSEQITGYQKILTGRQQVIARVPLQLPPQQFDTMGIWLEVPAPVQQMLERQQMHFMGSIHALEHAIIGTMPLLVLCDRNDIGGISYSWHEQIEKAAIFIYDAFTGGIGLCKQAFLSARELLEQTNAIIGECDCEHGCPSCVHSPKCGSGNRPIDKNGCRLLLNHLLNGRQQSLSLPPILKYRSLEIEQESTPFHLPERYGVFDLETKRSAQEVGGWHRADRMGIAMAVVYDGKTDTFNAYTENQISELLEHLFALDLVVGFNNKRFDNKVLSPYSSKSPSFLPSFDILEQITGQLGYRLSLNRLAEQTLGIQKSGDGLQSLQWYRQGEIEKIQKYCQKDVEITRDLFLHGIRQHYLLFQNKAGKVVRLPVDFVSALKNMQHKTD